MSHSLTDISYYDCFKIEGLRNIIYDFVDLKTLINLKITCKKYNTIDNKKIIIYKKLKEYINIGTINLIKNEKAILQINFINNTKYFNIRFEVFKILINKIIKKNNYSAIYLSSITDLLFLYHQEPNYIIWRKYFVNYLNDNISLIQKQNQLHTWDNIFYLRNHLFQNDDLHEIYSYNQIIKKYIKI